MKKIFSIILLLSFSTGIYAQWEQAGGSLAGGTEYVMAIGSKLFTCSGRVFFSLDNGDTWTLLNSLPVGCGTETITAIDTIVFVGGGNGVYRSTDWGTTWVQLNNGLSDTIVMSLAITGTNLIAGTYSGGVFVSSDYGLNWSPANTGLTNPYVKKIYVKDSIIYAGTSWLQGGVFISYNNGVSWVLSNNGLPEDDVSDIININNMLFCSFRDSGIYKSDDQGQSWTASNSGFPDSLTQNIYCLFTIGSNIFAGGFYNAYLSNDNGTLWQAYGQGLNYPQISCFSANSTYLFAATGGDGVWRRRLTDLSNPDIVGEPDIVKMYPNPAQEKLRLDFSFPTDVELKISFCDLLGNIIRIIDDDINGNDPIEISTADLPNGMYLVRIELSDRVIIKKVSVVR